MVAATGGPGDGREPGDGELTSPSRFPALARVVELMGKGELAAAFGELGVLLESEDEDLRPRVVLLLARISQARGDGEQMLRAYAVAADSGHPEVAPFAAAMLGGTFLELGQLGPARHMLKRAARASDPQLRQAARNALNAMPRRRWRWPQRR